MNNRLRPQPKSSKENLPGTTSTSSNHSIQTQRNSNPSKSLLDKKPNYKIEPSILPRPSEFEDIYENKDNKEPTSTYESNIDDHPPHSTSIYSVNETQNSSCRFVRSSLTKLPFTQGILSSSNLIFGLYYQPFAETQSTEEGIPKVEPKDSIFKCKTCRSYVNLNYAFGYSKSNKSIVKCNLCNFENELLPDYPGLKPEYQSLNNECPELHKPTIDFKVPESQMHAIPFIPHYIFMIDISSYSFNLGLPNYILNSLLMNIPMTHNAKHSYIGISTFDNLGVQFYSLGKINELKCMLMNDLNNPFSPMPSNQFCFNIIDERDKIEALVEKIVLFITERRKKPSPESNIAACAICSGIHSLKENGGRVLMFTCCPCLIGFGSTKLREDHKLFNTDNEKDLYIPQHSLFGPLIDEANSSRIAVDQFIFGTGQYDLGTMSALSNLTGGHIKYYPANPKDPQSLKSNFERTHYDILRILSRPNYYDINAVIRYSLGIECMEILGSFNKRLTESFQLPSCDPDFGFCYEFRLSENLSHEQLIHIQFAVMYTDNFNQRYIRMLNYSLKASSDVNQIFSSCDIDALAKITFMKEVSMRYHSTNKKIEENFIKKLVNTFYFYKKETSKTNSAQLALPGQVKNLPPFIHSFSKLGLYKPKKTGAHSSFYVHLIHSIMRDPIYTTLLQLYPKLYRIDNIDAVINPQRLRLSIEMIELDKAYASSNEEAISLFIFNQIENNQFYIDLFGLTSWEECVANEIDTLNEESLAGDIGQKLGSFIELRRAESFGLYLPIKVFFLNQSNARMCFDFNRIFVEDKNNEDIAYSDFLYCLHQLIEEKFK